MRQIDNMTPQEIEMLHLKGMLSHPKPKTKMNTDTQTMATQEHKTTCTSGNAGPEWTGEPNPENPDNQWICDECGAIITAD